MHNQTFMPLGTRLSPADGAATEAKTFLEAESVSATQKVNPSISDAWRTRDIVGDGDASR